MTIHLLFVCFKVAVNMLKRFGIVYSYWMRPTPIQDPELYQTQLVGISRAMRLGDDGVPTMLSFDESVHDWQS